jgi:glutaminyl-tRNA synthetase
MDPAKPVDLPERPKEATEPTVPPKKSKSQGAGASLALGAFGSPFDLGWSCFAASLAAAFLAAPKAKEAPAPRDPQAMFKVGFLHDVYQEKPLSETLGWSCFAASLAAAFLAAAASFFS